MDSRQQFEEWASKNNLLVDKTKLGTYCFGDTRDTWLAWQASRESLVVDLGGMTNNGYEGFYPANQIKRALLDSGIRTK